MTTTTSLRRASRRIHVLFGIALGGCLMNPLLDPRLALLAARVIAALTITFGWLIPGSWKRFIHLRSRRAPASAIAGTGRGSARANPVTHRSPSAGVAGAAMNGAHDAR